ncbi:Lcl domain-containing protein [Aquimarina sediminis]|uniref:Lcl domain-containing protein n=1 Tax=Aquimarina sediminis TaxID=2070536 RepID=UPI000CA06195|nr:DUF1566 domain-containing protein [Aquimarina sediminis]
MKKAFTFTKGVIVTLLLIGYSCKSDDDHQIEEPQIINLQDLEVTLAENPTVGQVVGTVQSDSSDPLAYSITTQTPNGAISIDTSTGELTVADATLFDFETNPVITATISADEAANTATVTINLTDVEVAIEDLTVAIDENPTNGDVVGTVQPNGGGNLNITSQTPAGALSIDANSGELTVADATLFDFETNPVITASVSDGEAINTATVTINLANVNEITVQDLTVAIDENPTNGDVVGTVQTNGSGALNFSITSQTPAGALNIDVNTGELTVADATLFDFETNPTITATITVGDGIAPANATVNLTNVNELSIQDFTTGIDENSPNGTVLGAVTATGDGTLVFSITSQIPVGALDINASTGDLTVADATLFDFETNTSITANITVGNSISTETAVVTIDLNDIHEVGDFKFGGVVFWVNATNDSGLVISAINNQPSGGPWGCHGVSIPGTNSAIGSGAANTVVIEAACTTSGTAADFAANLDFNGYDDWFLPSRDELLEYYANKSVVDAAMIASGGTIPYQFHWSSTELLNNTDNAALVNLTTGLWGNFNKSFNYAIRVVRAF